MWVKCYFSLIFFFFFKPRHLVSFLCCFQSYLPVHFSCWSKLSNKRPLQDLLGGGESPLPFCLHPRIQGNVTQEMLPFWKVWLLVKACIQTFQTQKQKFLKYPRGLKSLWNDGSLFWASALSIRYCCSCNAKSSWYCYWNSKNRVSLNIKIPALLKIP